MRNRLCLAAIVLIAAGCGRDGAPGSPSAVNLTGTWRGTLAEQTSQPACPSSWVGQFCGVGQSTWVLTQSGTAVSGTFTLIFPVASPPFAVSQGSVTGTLSGSTLDFMLRVSFPPQSSTATVNGTAQVGSANMTGTYSGTFFAGTIFSQPFGNGQVALVKQ